MGNEFTSQKAQENQSRQARPLDPYLSALREQSRPVGAGANPLKKQSAVGNQASIGSPAKPTLESVRFPFVRVYPGFVPSPTVQYDLVMWSEVETRFNALIRTSRDDAAVTITEYLQSKGELGIVAADPRGRRILVRLYDELTSGSVWDDERAAADILAKKLTASISPKQFAAGAEKAAVIPISSDGLTHGSFLQSKLLPSGKIWIKPNSSVEEWSVKKNYPDFFELNGAEFDPLEIVNVVLTDESPTPHPILAVELMRFGNATEYDTLKKAVEAAAAGATAPFSAAGLGGRTLFEGAAANSPRLARLLSLTSGVSETSMTAARGISAAVELADVAAFTWGGISFFIHSIEGGLIRRFGNDAKELLRLVHVIDTAAFIYGFARVAVDLGDLVYNVHKRGKALQEAARQSAPVGGDKELEALEVIVDKTAELTEQQKKILELNQKTLPGGMVGDTAKAKVAPTGKAAGIGSAEESIPPAWLLDDLNKGKTPTPASPVGELRAELSATPSVSPLSKEPGAQILPRQESPNLMSEFEISMAGRNTGGKTGVPRTTPVESTPKTKDVELISPAKTPDVANQENPYSSMSPTAPAPISDVSSGQVPDFGLVGLEPALSTFKPATKTLGKGGKKVSPPSKPTIAKMRLGSEPQPKTLPTKSLSKTLNAALNDTEQRIAALSNHPDAPALQRDLDYIRMWADKGREMEAQELLKRLNKRVEASKLSRSSGALQPHYEAAEEGASLRTIEYNPELEVVPTQLDPTAPLVNDETGQILMQHVEAAIARFEREGLTEQQIIALRTLEGQQRSALYDAYRGSRIDEFAKETAMQDSRLEHVYVTVLRERGPDFFDSRTGTWYDITTPGAWHQHVNDYGGQNFGGFRLPSEPR